MATISTGHQRSTAKYRVLEQDSQTGLQKVKGVFGLGSCTYKQKMYYFFGGLGFNKSLGERLCTSQVIEFDPETRHYERINLWCNPDRLLSERRYITTLLLGKNLLCLGGINKHGYGLKDVICIDMDTKEWKELPITNPSQGPGPVYSSAMCLVAYKERERLELNNMSDIKWELVT